MVDMEGSKSSTKARDLNHVPATEYPGSVGNGRDNPSLRTMQDVQSPTLDANGWNLRAWWINTHTHICIYIYTCIIIDHPRMQISTNKHAWCSPRCSWVTSPSYWHPLLHLSGCCQGQWGDWTWLSVTPILDTQHNFEHALTCTKKCVCWLVPLSWYLYFRSKQFKD